MRRRLPIALLSLVGGAATAVSVVVLHRAWWGLLLGLPATAAVLIALPRGWWCRLPYAVGWSGVVLLLSAARPEGDYLIASDAAGYTVLAAAFVVLVAGVVGLRPAPPRSEDSGQAPTSS